MSKINLKTTAIRPHLGGVVVVCCVHDREKRVFVDREKMIHGLQKIGEYDPKIHLVHLCACCENLFVSLDDTPRMCDVCGTPIVFPLGGPLPTPIGEV